MALLRYMLTYHGLVQSEQKVKKGPSEQDAEEDEENLGEEDSQFMKLAKKVTAKTLQRKGQPP